MKTALFMVLSVLSSCVCMAMEEGRDTTKKQVYPAQLTVSNDSIMLGKIVGNDSFPGMIDIQEVIRDKDRTILVTGAIWGVVLLGDSFVTSKGMGDCFTARFAPDGTLLWLAIRGTKGNEIGYGITLDPSGKIYVVGAWDDSVSRRFCFQRASLGWGGTDAFMLMFDPSNYFSPRTWIIAAGKGNNAAFAVTTDIWSNVYVTGVFRGTAIIGGDTCKATGDNDSLGDVFMLKLDPYGRYLITQTDGTEWDDDRGVYIAVSYVSTQVVVYLDINVASQPLYFLPFDDYGMAPHESSDISNQSINLHFEEFEKKKRTWITR